MSESLESRILRWTLTKNTGASSKCLAAHLTGNECDGSYPHDAGDFERCIGLLECAPELRQKLHKMAEVNEYWAALVKIWDKIEQCKTTGEQYKLLQQTLRPIEDRDRNHIRLNKNVSIRFGGKI